MAQSTLGVRFADAPEQRYPLTADQVASFQAFWDEAPDESESIKPAIADILNLLAPTLGDQFLAAPSGRITLRTGPRLLGSTQGFSW